MVYSNHQLRRLLTLMSPQQPKLLRAKSQILQLTSQIKLELLLCKFSQHYFQHTPSQVAQRKLKLNLLVEVEVEAAGAKVRLEAIVLEVEVVVQEQLRFTKLMQPALHLQLMSLLALVEMVDCLLLQLTPMEIQEDSVIQHLLDRFVRQEEIVD
jgi:hypothetical protein